MPKHAKQRAHIAHIAVVSNRYTDGVAGWGAVEDAGRVKKKVEPLPGADSTPIVPPMSSTNFLQM